MLGRVGSYSTSPGTRVLGKGDRPRSHSSPSTNNTSLDGIVAVLETQHAPRQVFSLAVHCRKRVGNRRVHEEEKNWGRCIHEPDAFVPRGQDSFLFAPEGDGCRRSSWFKDQPLPLRGPSRPRSRLTTSRKGGISSMLC